MKALSQTTEEFCHPIKLVSTRTGLSKDVIRIWERRYNAISPGRTDTGRRLYSDAHIDHLVKLKQVTDAGWRISDATKLSDTELNSLIDELNQSADTLCDSSDVPAVNATASSYMAESLVAIEALDAGRLKGLLASASIALAIPRLLDDLIAPLLREIGDRWHHGDLRVGHEHLATSEIRRFLDNLRESTGMQTDGPVIVVTTPAGYSHEMGALMAAVAASTAGWKTVYLSPNLPAREIVASVELLHAKAVALSMVYPTDNPIVIDELRFLKEYLPTDCSIFVGGQAALSYKAILDEIDAVYLSRFNDVIESLIRLRES